MSTKKPTVDEFLVNLHHDRINDIRRIRAALLAADDELDERIKWNAPSFGHDDEDRVTFRIQPHQRFELILHRGVQQRDDPFTFEDPDHLITWATSDRGTVIMPISMTADEEDRLVALAHRWLQATRSRPPTSPDTMKKSEK